MNDEKKISAEYKTALERTCKRKGLNFLQTKTFLEVFFEEAQIVVKETGKLDIPNFLSFRVQKRGGHADKFYRLNEKGDKVYRLDEEGNRLMIKKVKFPSVKAQMPFKKFVRGESKFISAEAEKFSKLKKLE